MYFCKIIKVTLPLKRHTCKYKIVTNFYKNHRNLDKEKKTILGQLHTQWTYLIFFIVVEKRNGRDQVKKNLFLLSNSDFHFVFLNCIFRCNSIFFQFFQFHDAQKTITSTRGKSFLAIFFTPLIVCYCLRVSVCVCVFQE